MKIIKQKYVKNIQYHFIGAIFLILNYIRHTLFGYRTPRTFSIDRFGQAVDYDFKVVEEWVKHLSSYSREVDPLKGKVVLELGPGPDLGIGLILLAMGVKKYVALDVNKLAKSTPLGFYEKLLCRLKKIYPGCDTDYLNEQLDKCYKGEEGRISYLVDNNFEIKKIRDKIDIVFSQAAFEHFIDVRKTFKELNSVVKKGGILIAMIDLKTHTRWIRDKDPLNIYRYSDLYYNIFKFNGSPNRVSASEYKKVMEANNWVNIKIEPLKILEKEYVDKIKPSLNKKFKDLDSSELQLLSITLMAKRK